MALKPEQSETVQALRRLGIGAAADFYADACALVETRDGLHAVTHLVGHCVREAESALRDALLPLVPGATGETRESRDAAEGFLRSAGIEDGSAEWAFFFELAEARDLSTRRSHRASIDLITAGLGQDASLVAAWHGLRKRLHEWAHRSGILKARPLADSFWKMWEDAERLFVLVVSRLEASYHVVSARVDELLQLDAPTNQDASAFRGTLLRSAPALDRFFAGLTNPRWVPLLVHEGLFGAPPGREHDEDAGSTSHPRWPASQFLRRVADEPDWPAEALLEGILAVPKTNNRSVVKNLLHAACACPSPSVAGWARDWVADGLLDGLDGPLFGVFADVSGLVRHLAAGGEAASALHLARALYRVLPPRVVDHGLLGVSRTPQTLSAGSEFYYERGLAQDVPALAAADLWETLSLLSDLTDAYAALGAADPLPAPLDGSGRWLDDIGEDEPGRTGSREIGAWLARALCRTAVDAVASGAARVDDVTEWLEARGRHVYMRCSLTVLRVHGEADAIAAALTDRDRVFDDVLGEETLRLVEQRIHDLDADAQEGVLRVLAAGPAPETELWRAERYGWGEVTIEEARERSAAVREHWLARLRPVLPARWVDANLELFPAPAPPPAPAVPPGVKTLDALRTELTADPPAALRRLAQWDAYEHPPSIEGAAFRLEEAVRENRPAFAANADGLIGADATLVGALVSGLADNENGPETIAVADWGPLLRLCDWAARQPREIEGRDWERWARERDGDPHWGWTRKKIARLLQRAVWAGAVPWVHYEAVWAVVRRLSDDPDPLPEDESGATGRGALNRAINTTRGDAMGAVFAVVAWVHREAGDPAGAAPDVFDVLDAHLETDPSPAIRAVYGQHLPLLASVAPAWTAARLGHLFPETAVLREATWDGYGYARNDSNAALRLLRPVYLAELEQVTADTVTEIVHPEEPFLRRERVREVVGDWADQIVGAYLLGAVGLDDGDVGAALFGHPVEAVRALAVERVGRTLRDSWGGHAPRQVVDRAASAWEWRTRRGALTAGEGEAFALWPPSAPFAPAWALRQLERAIEASGGELSQGFRVAKWLPTVAVGNALASVRVLVRIVGGSEGVELTSVYPEEARAVLLAAWAADGEARTLAREIVNRLVARGGPDFSGALG